MNPEVNVHNPSLHPPSGTSGTDGISVLHTGRYGVTLSFPAATNLSRRYRAWGFMASRIRRTSNRFPDFGQIG